MFKKLFRWIRSLFKRNTKEYITYKTDDVIKPTAKDKSHEARLTVFKEKSKEQNKKNYPIIRDRSYSRTYSRYQIAKMQKQEQRDLVLQGQRKEITKDKKGRETIQIVEVQKPYTKNEFKTFKDYQAYQRTFNYNNR